MNGCVIIGDIVGSQKLDDLPAVVARLRTALRDVNRRYRRDLLGKFTIFAGDSFEGALRTPEHAYDICRCIAGALRPVRLRCVACVGKITDLADGNVLEMNGPIFTRAAQALRSGQVNRQGLRLISGKPARDDTVNAFLALIEAATARWDSRTYLIAGLSGSQPVAEIAEKVSMNRTSVWKRMRRHHVAEVLQAEDEIRKALLR